MSEHTLDGATVIRKRELTIDELDAVVSSTTAYVPHTYAIRRIEARFQI